MTWKETYNNESTDGATHHINCELWIDFDPTRWNKNIASPVLSITWHDYKKEKSWPLCHFKVCLGYPVENCKNCVVHTQGLNRRCDINFNYFQRMPKISLFSGYKNGSNYDPTKDNYDEFTLEYCKAKAIELFKINLQNVSNQLK